MEIILIILIVALILGVAFAVFLIQKQITSLNESVNAKLEQNNARIQDSITSQLHESNRQLHESNKVVADISARIATITETNKHVVSVADELKSLQAVLQNPKQRGVFGEYYLDTVLSNILPPSTYQLQYKFKDGEIVSDTRKSNEFYEVTDTLKPVKRSKIDAIKYSFLESFGMSVHAIVSNKMRSLLTMLGIIIGIASVVSVVALGNASQAKIMEQINSMGTNTIDIMPGKSFGDMRSGKVKTLKVSDSDYLAKQGFIDNSTPSVSASGTLVFGNYSLTAQLKGVGAEFFEVKGRKIAQGRIFTKQEVQTAASVVVIDDNTLNEIFADNPNPIGEIIIFNKKPLKVIGVTEKNS